ncbi:hypothetical protein FCV25MIE_13907 [Fagus crenata]
MAMRKKTHPNMHVKEESNLGHASNYEVKHQRGFRSYLRIVRRWQLHLPEAAMRVARQTALMEAQQPVGLRRTGEGSDECVGRSGLAEEGRGWMG